MIKEMKYSVPENSLHGPGMGILDSGPGKTSKKSNLCVKPEADEGVSPCRCLRGKLSRLGQ